MPSEVAVVPNHAAEVQIPSQLVGQSAPPRNTLLERSYELIGGVGGVRAEPSEVHFAGIARDVDKVATLRLVNASAAPTRMHIHPPSTPFFSMSIVKRGRVMPGMAEEVRKPARGKGPIRQTCHEITGQYETGIQTSCA
eukprot:768514-Pleurochrysis_carterae.AAC.6